RGRSWGTSGSTRRSECGNRPSEGLGQLQARRLPSPLERALRYAQGGGRLGLRQPLVEQQVEGLARLRGQGPGPAMELAPAGEATGIERGVRRVQALPDGPGAEGPEAMRAGIAPGEVDQFAADLHRRQSEEVRGCRRADLVQGPAEPQGGVLQDVVGL